MVDSWWWAVSDADSNGSCSFLSARSSVEKFDGIHRYFSTIAMARFHELHHCIESLDFLGFYAGGWRTYRASRLRVRIIYILDLSGWQREWFEDMVSAPILQTSIDLWYRSLRKNNNRNTLASRIFCFTFLHNDTIHNRRRDGGSIDSDASTSFVFRFSSSSSRRSISGCVGQIHPVRYSNWLGRFSIIFYDQVFSFLIRRFWIVFSALLRRSGLESFGSIHWLGITLSSSFLCTALHLPHKLDMYMFSYGMPAYGIIMA